MAKGRMEVTPVGIANWCRLSSPNVKTDKSSGDTWDEYSMCIMFDKTVDLQKLHDMVKEQIKAQWSDKIPKKLKLPIKDGDDTEDDNSGEQANLFGKFYLNCKTKFEPKVVGRDLQPLPLSSVYSGCKVRASLVAKAFESSDGAAKGVTFYLQNIQFIADGEPLGGSGMEVNEFEEMKEY